MKKAALMLACMFAAYTLFGQTHWPKPTNFSGSVTANSVLVINGEESLADYIEIGAFCGEECRGAALPYGTLVAGHRIYFLSIAGNTNGQTITFRLWDHQSNKELEYECQTTVNFQDNLILGQIPNNLFEIGFTAPQTTVTQPIRLSKGWNWISTYIEMDGVDGISMLETSLNGNGLMIKFGIQYTEYDAEWDEWFGNGLTALTNDKMYLVKTSTACEVAFVGTVANIANHPVTIKHGWNWIGFPSDHSMTVEDALTRFTPETGDKIQYGTLFTEYDTEWNMWIGNGLNDLVPGRGYLYYSNSTENKTLIF